MKHPIEKVWDTVTEIAVEGTMTGKLDVTSKGATTGRMTFDTEDGRRFSVYVEEVKE